MVIFLSILLFAGSVFADTLLDVGGKPLSIGGNVLGVGAGTTPPATYWTDTNSYLMLLEFETTNTVAYLDTSGNARHGTNNPNMSTGCAQIESGTNQHGRIEHALSLDGSSDYLAINDDAVWTLGGNATFLYWLASTDSSGAIISHYDSVGFTIEQGTLGGGGAIVWDNSGDWGLTDSVVPTNWTHYAITYGDGYRRLYRNGILKISEFKGNIGDANNALRIGMEAPSQNRPLVGLIDNVAVANYAFTSNSVFDQFTYTHPTNNIRLRP